MDAEAAGRRFLPRTAASFVPLWAGLGPRPLLTPTDLNLPTAGGGLVVVGSHVPTTSKQLAMLLDQTGIVGVEVDIAALVDDTQRGRMITRLSQEIDDHLYKNEDVIVYTSRVLPAGTDSDTSLMLGQRVATGLVAIVRALTARPRYVCAKGGITSSELATAALGVRRALVLGQIQPGIPVWRLGSESRFPDLTYIVFPGNVGGPTTLAEIVAALRHEPVR